MNKIILILLLIATTSCHEEWLDIKRNKEQVVPQTLQDLQALLDNSGVMNAYVTPALGELSTDDYYLSLEEWESLPTPEQRNGYIWAANIYEGNTCYSWNLPYRQVLYANLALEGAEKLNPGNDKAANIRGSALFYRAWAFFQLAQVFCPPYDASSANSDPGIPLRLEADVNLTSVRSTVQQTYDRIIMDLKEAAPLLPKTPLVKTRPCQAAVYALLSKTYLQMEAYDEALKYADQALQLQNELLDFNQLDLTADYPFPLFNEEVIFHASLDPLVVFLRMRVSPELFNLYSSNDLRKAAFFRDEPDFWAFKGSYNENMYLFSGIAVDEVYLIRAECYLRQENSPAALSDLNYLLETRWQEGTFVPLVAGTDDELLAVILEERRKSLLFRGIRWMDLRRLNKKPETAKDLVRSLNGQEYKLPANDPRYVLPIPDEVIEISGMTQNMR